MRHVVALVLVGWITAPAIAQQRPAQRDTSVLERVVVTASRREERLKDVVVQTELVSRAALERTGAADLASALHEAAGLQIDGGTPAGVGVALRGFDSRRVLILIDGQPFVGRLAGHLDLSRIPVASIERVEIVRGPQSTLYGADALGGVVNIITRRPLLGDRAASLSLTGGTNRRRDAAVSASIGSEQIAIRVAGGRRLTSLAPGIASDDATFARSWDGSAGILWSPRPAMSLEVASHGVRESQRYRTGQLYRFSDNAQLGFRAAAGVRRGSTRWSAALSHSHYDHLARTATASVPVSDSGASDRQALTQLQVGYSTVVKRGTLDAGVDVRDERIRADRVRGTSRNAQSIEPFVQVAAQFGPVTVAPGVRASLHETWGTFIAPRVAVASRLSDELTLRAALGTGYRPPDFKELYISFANPAAGYAVEGNPDLRPEHSVTASLGVNAEADAWGASITLFGNRFRDFITTGEQDAAGVFRYENIASGRTSGIEATVRFAPPGATVEAGYDYTATRDRQSRAPLPNIAPHQGRVLLTSRPLNSTSLTIGTHYASATPLQRGLSGSASRARAAYAHTDVRVTRAFAAGLRARAGVSNVFDRSLGDGWPGFTGRQVFAAVDWEFARRR